MSQQTYLDEFAWDFLQEIVDQHPDIELVRNKRKIGVDKQGHYMMEGEHHVLFLSDSSYANDGAGQCTHTLYLEHAKNKFPNILDWSEEEFEKHFEKLYFTDDDYDWWEKEES